MSTDRSPTKRRSPKRGEGPAQQLFKALSHELRVELLTYLTEHSSGSASEMARALGEQVPLVSHHAKQLVKYGLAELVEERPVRKGTAEKVYRATERPLVDTAEVDCMPVPVRRGFAGQIVQKAVNDAVDGFKADAFGRRSDWHLTRTPLELDEEGWQEVRAIHERALDETLAVQRKSAGRRARSNEQPVRIFSSQLCFVMPRASAD